MLSTRCVRVNEWSSYSEICMAVNPTLSHYVAAIVHELPVQLMLDTGAGVISLVRRMFGTDWEVLAFLD